MYSSTNGTDILSTFIPIVINFTIVININYSVAVLRIFACNPPISSVNAPDPESLLHAGTDEPSTRTIQCSSVWQHGSYPKELLYLLEEQAIIPWSHGVQLERRVH